MDDMDVIKTNGFHANDGGFRRRDACKCGCFAGKGRPEGLANRHFVSLTDKTIGIARQPNILPLLQ